MRYLWIEDFDGGNNGQTQLQDSLERYFQLKNRNINFCTLETTLKFLDNPDNWRLFDAILIDIRFKVCEKKEYEDKIYFKYFSSFLTEEKYRYYTKCVNNDANTASAGVLLYLVLIHKYNYNQNRIAFISANVDEMSDKLACFANMKEYITKARHVKLTSSDLENFSLLNEDAFNVFMEEFDMKEEAEKEFDIPITDEIDWDRLEDLEKKIDSVEKKFKKQILKKSKNDKVDENVNNLKYNSVKQEFEAVGLKVPIAFEKPIGNNHSDISWKFQSWVDNELNSDYYRLRSMLLPVCLEIIQLEQNLMKQDIFNIVQFPDIKELILNIVIFFPENRWVDDNTSLYLKVVKECVIFCDSIPKFKMCQAIDPFEYSFKAVLKITRNWTYHQGISRIEIFDVVFIFHIFINTFLNVDMDEKLKILDQALITEFCKNNFTGYKEGLINQLKTKYLEMHRKSYNELSEQNREEAEKKGYRFNASASFYDIISAIGHECSPIKKNVSMEMIYSLFLVLLGEDIVRNSEDIFINEVINRIEIV